MAEHAVARGATALLRAMPLAMPHAVSAAATMALTIAGAKRNQIEVLFFTIYPERYARIRPLFASALCDGKAGRSTLQLALRLLLLP